MITVKNKQAQSVLVEAGNKLAHIVYAVEDILEPGVTTADVDSWIASALAAHDFTSCSKGYMGYKHVSCVSVNDEIVHGVPSDRKIVREGDLVSVDVCARWNGFCVDMARSFLVRSCSQQARDLVAVAQASLDAGIDRAVDGGRLGDISAAIQHVVEKHGYGVVRDFCGHGIGKKMHEEPEIPNYGRSGAGPVLRSGMVFAIEPMITLGGYHVRIDRDGWTARTVDGSLAAHVEDTVIITDNGPLIVTRLQD